MEALYIVSHCGGPRCSTHAKRKGPFHGEGEGGGDVARGAVWVEGVLGLYISLRTQRQIDTGRGKGERRGKGEEREREGTIAGDAYISRIWLSSITSPSHCFRSQKSRLPLPSSSTYRP